MTPDAAGDRRLPATPEAFVASLRGTPYEELFRDEARLDALMADLLRGSSDPMAREVGQGLGDGSLSLGDVGGSSVYAEFVARGLSAAAGLDPWAALGEPDGDVQDTDDADDGVERPGADGARTPSDDQRDHRRDGRRG